MSKRRLVRLVAGVYIWFFRGTPVIVQIFFMYLGVNILFGHALIPNELNLGAFTLGGAALAGILALGINEGAYMREIIRAGIDAIDRGQMEAARSIGLSRARTYSHVILPQAFRIVVPTERHIGLEMDVLDPVLKTLATGKLELEVKDAVPKKKETEAFTDVVKGKLNDQEAAALFQVGMRLMIDFFSLLRTKALLRQLHRFTPEDQSKPRSRKVKGPPSQ